MIKQNEKHGYIRELPIPFDRNDYWGKPTCVSNDDLIPQTDFCETKGVFILDLLTPTMRDRNDQCSAYENVITTSIENAQNKVLELSSTNDISTSRRLQIIEEAAHMSNRLLEVSRNKIWKLVKNQNEFPDRSILKGLDAISPLLDNGVDRYEAALNLIAIALIDNNGVDLNFEIDIDDDDCVIVNWLFESGSYEWTIVNDNSPWPMVKVYEYCSGVFDSGKEADVRTWHHVSSLLKRFKIVVSENSKID